MSRGLLFSAIALLFSTAPATGQQPLPNAKPDAPIVVNEDKDGLPGAAVGPSRRDIEDLIRGIGRDPVSDELVDRIDAIFRPRWVSLRKFDDVRRRAIDPVYIAKVDAAARDLTKKAADTRLIVMKAAAYVATTTEDEATVRDVIREDLARENGPRRTIQGRIVDEETGRPLAGVVVSGQGNILTRTDDKGNYVLKTRGPLGNKLFALTVEAPGYALTQTMLDWTDLLEPEVQDFRLPLAAVFGGRVIDAAGKPIVGVEMELSMQANATFRDDSMQKRGQAPMNSFRARTDDNGVYAFRNVPPDNGSQQWAYRFTAMHPKFQPRSKQYIPKELLGPGWEITLEPGHIVRGIVVDEAGKPVPNANITAQFNPIEYVYPVTTSDAEGKFRFTNLPQLEVQLVARSDLFVYSTVNAKAEKDEPAEVKLVMTKGEYFEGKVVDQENKPVEGVTVGYLVPVNAEGTIIQNPQQRVNLGNRNTRTREDGTFKLGPVPKGRYRIRGIRNGPNGTQSVFNTADTGAKDVVLKLGQ